MIKTVFPFAGVGVQVARLVDVHSRGVDRDWMQKRAAVLTKEIEEVRPEEGHSFIHAISMGAGEYYGSNRNGDFFNSKAARVEFPEPEKGGPSSRMLSGGLQEYHKTFTKYAKVYHDHSNKDPELAYGDIVAEAYNPDMHRGELLIRLQDNKWAPELEKMARGENTAWSMSCRVPYDTCLAPGTIVRTARGAVPIEHVTEADTVLTHTGQYRRVTGKIHTVLRRPGVGIQLRGRPDPILATEEHPFFVMSSVAATANQKQYRRKEAAGDVVVGVTGYESPDFVEAKQLNEADFCLFPVRREGLTPEVDPWLSGLYLADGSLFGVRHGRNKRKGHWRLTGVQWSLGTDKREIIDRLVDTLKQMDLTPRVYQLKHVKAVSVVVHSRKLAKTLGRNFDRTERKHLSPRVLKWHPDYLLALLAGWLDGDGSQDIKKGSVRGHSVLDCLVEGLWEAAIIAGVPAAWHREPLDNEWAVSAHINVLHFSTAAAVKLSEHSTRIIAVPRRLRQSSFYIEDGGVEYFAIPIMQLTPVELYETYNLSVESDESYVAGGILSHNCSICGHQAPNRKEYCDHLKNEMGQVKAGGHQVYAINDRPMFFDYSGVFRGADRIAYGLRKVASTGEMPEEFIPSTMLAEQWGVSAPKSVLFDSSPHHVQEKLAAMERLAAMEKQIEATGSAVSPEIDSAVNTSNLDDDTGSKLRGLDFNEMMGALSQAKICLPVKDFFRLILGKKYDSVAGEMDDTESILPGIFGRMLNTGDGVEDVTGMKTYDPEASLLPKQIRDLIENVAPEMSLGDGPVGRRVQISIIRGGGPVKSTKNAHVKSASDNKVAHFLAKQYVAYQLAFSQSLGGKDGGLADGLMVRRNYVA